jgi:hypothetical protein
MQYEPALCVPTFSACLENGRGDGGNHGYVSVDRDIVSFGLGAQLESMSSEQESACLIASLSEDHRVQYQAIPEPCKVRVITKGRANLYTGLRRLQGFMLSQWKKMPFGTMTDSFEERLKFRIEDESLIDDGDLNISGDYSSATDKMHMDVSLTIMEEILRNVGLLGSLLGDCAIRSFTGALIEYPDGDVIEQTNGQLMGHPLSFVLLCIENLATYMYTTNRYTLLELVRSPFLINGDDILFRGTVEMYDRWRAASSRLGLVVNESKTYVHPVYYLINSYMGVRGKGKVQYYNRALAIGHGVKHEPVRMITQASQLWDELKHTLDRVTKRGRKHLLKSIKKYLRPQKGSKFSPNYFVPKALGGLGLSDDGRAQVKITFEQRKIATYLMRRPWVNVFMERLGDNPVSVQEALKHLKKMLPALSGKRFIGPLLPMDDYSTVVDLYLSRALQFCAWRKNTVARSQEEVRRWFHLQILKNSREKCARAQKILNYEPWREMIPNFPSPIYKIHSPASCSELFSSVDGQPSQY